LSTVHVRRLTAHDAEAFREVRLRSLRDDPAAFTNSYEEFSRQPIERVRTRLTGEGDDFMLGAFLDGELVGTVGFYRETALKLRHKGHLVTMYVTPERRGQGVGKALLREALRRIRALDGLEQVLLGVVVTQTAAKRLYQSLGFQVYGREARAVKIGEQYLDEEFMMLELKRGDA
jgi:ribosomal protein S18 acetylase RimI-like enzyme